MNLTIPELSLVVLIGVSGSGKSTFARAHFKPTEVISSDFCRGLVADDENDQSATPAAFAVLRFIAGQRLAAGRLTVIDATNVQPEARRDLVTLAREYDVLPTAIVLDLPERLCAERNQGRPDRDFGAHVLRRQHGQLRRGLRGLGREGFRTVHVLHSPEEVDAAAITRTRLYTDKRDETGPFDIIGDVHGCRAELEELLTTLGYDLDRDAAGRPVGARHPGGRRAIFVGNLVDRGPDTPGVLRLVMGMVAAGAAFCVAGNHEVKLLKALRGKNVKRSHGLDASMEQLEAETPEFRAAAERFIDGLISHYVFDGGNLVVAHAGLIEPLSRPRLRPGPRVLPVRPDHRRDRRVRPAGPLPVGHRIPGPRRRGVRSHPRADGGMAEQHAVRGHRLRLRWPSDRPQISRTGYRLRPRRPHLPPPGPAVPDGIRRRGRRRAPRTRRARHRRRVRVPGHRDRLPAAGRRPRRARRRRARGDEPVRDRPALAPVPAADHEPGGHVIA